MAVSEAKKAYTRAWRLANPEKVRAQKQAWNAANPDRLKTYAERCTPAKRSAAWNKWYTTHQEICKARRRAKYAANPEKCREQNRITRRDRPELKVMSEGRRRALKLGAGGIHTLAQWRAKLALHGHRCFYCGASERLTKDHDRPLARGGGDQIGNLLPACQSCNSRKHTKTAAEYLLTNRSRT